MYILHAGKLVKQIEILMHTKTECTDLQIHFCMHFVCGWFPFQDQTYHISSAFLHHSIPQRRFQLLMQTFKDMIKSDPPHNYLNGVLLSIYSMSKIQHNRL